MGRAKLLLVHHFSLSHVTGVTVMIAEIMRLFPSIGEGVADYLSFSGTPDDLIRELDEKHDDSTAVIGINLHIEVQWEHSLVLLEWCKARGIPVWIYVHDYWPHHFDNIAAVVEKGAKLLASTTFLQESLAADGYAAEVVTVGVPLPEELPPPPPSPWPTMPLVFASSGRLTPRKRFYDIVRAFRDAALEDRAILYLRLLPSHVFDSSDDAEQIKLIENEITKDYEELGRVRLDRTPSACVFDYTPYFAYVCSSAYEGFSMSPIESAYFGCPPLMSCIPAHKVIAQTLFGERARDFLYPLGDTDALAGMMRDEAATGRRRKLLAAHSSEIRAMIKTRWSLATTAKLLAGIGKLVRPERKVEL
ncbi:MAG: hypothetical protein WCO89_00890 [Syntrophus sp. (in: bacteria)]